MARAPGSCPRLPRFPASLAISKRQGTREGGAFLLRRAPQTQEIGDGLSDGLGAGSSTVTAGSSTLTAVPTP